MSTISVYSLPKEAIPHARVELLKDKRGPYGLGLLSGDGEYLGRIITRPDRVFVSPTPCETLLHTVPKRLTKLRTIENEFSQALRDILMYP